MQDDHSVQSILAPYKDFLSDAASCHIKNQNTEVDGNRIPIIKKDVACRWLNRVKARTK